MKLSALMFAGALFAALLAGCGGGNGNTPTPTTADSASSGTAAAASDAIACTLPDGGSEEIDAAKLYFEYNSTDEDTGVHGLFDSSGFSELCVYAPNGQQILAVKPQGQLKDLGMGGIFFESREPEEGEVSQEEIVGSFPEGSYDVITITHDGEGLTGAATFTHDIPLAPTITFPNEGDAVDPNNLVVTWEPVTQSVNGDPVEIIGYEVIVTDEESEDPNGLGQLILSAHVSPSVTSLTIPSEFLVSGTEYELEVLALEESGNQTISIVFFETE